MLDWLRGARRRQFERDMDEEMRLHLQECSEELQASGAPDGEARRRARVAFGGLERVQEECRDTAGARFFQTLRMDLRFAGRMLRRAPGFTVVAILTLALGISVNTAIFSIVDSLLLRPLPVRDPSQLAVLAFRQGNGPLLTQFSVADAADIRTQAAPVFADMLGFQLGFDGLSRRGKANRVLAAYVTGNYFSMLGLDPERGRLFRPDEGRVPGADPVVVLASDYWHSQFAGDPAIVGQQVQINGQPATVVGIAARGFAGLYPAPEIQAFIPLAMVAHYEPGWPADMMSNRILQNVFVLGRLQPRANLSQAVAALDVIARRLAAQYPATDKGMRLSAYAERRSRPDPTIGPTAVAAAELFLGLAGLVLLLACANLASLLLARGAAREREMAIRAALGAAPGRLRRQVLSECLCLLVPGCAAGLAAGVWIGRMLGSINLHQVTPLLVYRGLDWRVFFYTVAAALVATAAAALAPMRRAAHSDARAALQRSGGGVAGGRHRLRSTLVAVQVAGSTMLLVMAMLFTRSLLAAQRADLGFDPQSVTQMAMDPTEVGANRAQGLHFYSELLQRVGALPGVESAALTSCPPIGVGEYLSNDYLKIGGYQVPSGQGLPLVAYSVVSAGYLGTLRIPVVQGRDFSPNDAAGAPYVAIVNQAFAAKYWPGQDPVGKVFAKLSGATNPKYEVIGVASDSRFLGLTGPIAPYFYLPLAQDYDLGTLQFLQVRSSLPPAALLGAARDVVHTLQPDLPVFDAGTLTASMNTLSGFLVYRLGAGLAVALGLLGLLLAMIG
ncbi:MAG TPA: ADOP family duplicated permease, partial [Terriglobales bacterium]|nr:ADOP family duplicated permease [Terriglobales bacterium]